MGYFPFFIDIAKAPGLIIGGGVVALRKAEKLLPYGPRLKVVAPALCPELEALGGILIEKRPFVWEDLEGAAFVIACTDDRALNHEIAARCRARRVPVNVVDDPEACSFYFPALVKRGKLSIGVCTEGASPPAAAYIRQAVEKVLPDGIEAILEQMEALRETVKRDIPEQPERASVLRAVLSRALALGRPLSAAELAAFLPGAAGPAETEDAK